MGRRRKSWATGLGYPSSASSGWHSTTPQIPPPRREKSDPVPKEWTENAATPWRILFPDLDWTPPDRDL